MRQLDINLPERASLAGPGWYNDRVKRVVTYLTACLLAVTVAAAPSQAAERVDYNDHVRPILSDRCYSCHGPDEVQRQAGLRLDREESAFGAAEGRTPAIVRGNPAESSLLQRVASTDPARRMPPAYLGHDPLGRDEIEVLREWIEQGATWEGHWSFTPPIRPAIPELRQRIRPGSAIDALVDRRLEAEGLQRAAAADRRTIARRAALDLTGLPATPDVVDAFVADQSPGAYEAFLDHLLSSARYGEHWAAMWLDAARYADTNGYQTDGTRSMWRWRDWVIDAFNRNLPFDQFTIEQLAGDMLPDATGPQIVASGFNRNHRTTAEGGSVNEEFRVEYVADRAETTATVWLGLTLGCARCHDHKFDPLSQREYYQFFAYFNNVREKGMVWNFGNEDPLVRAPTQEQEERLGALAAKLSSAKSRWDAMERQIARAQAKWERGLVATAEASWAPKRGLRAQASFDGRLNVVSFTGGSIDGSSKPQPVTTEFAEGHSGRSAVFDGGRYADLGKVGIFNYMDPLSVSAWIFPESSADGSIVASMGENPIGSGWGLFVRGGKLWWHMAQRWSDLSMRVATKHKIEPGQWQHVLLTYDGNRKAKGVRMYINGVAQEFDILFDNLDWPSQSNESLKVGGGGGPDNRFTGRIDEVRVYGRALTQAESLALASTEPLASLAAVPESDRSPVHLAKLRAAFLNMAASPAIRTARLEAEEAQRRHDSFRDSIPTVMVMREGPPRQAYVLERGRYDSHGEPVGPGIPGALLEAGAPTAGNRLDLARWIASRSNPLTARVIVNRFWQMLFGVGLVKTVDDFGSQGEAPANQELLDWLAVEFMDSGWDVKHLLKTITLSATYRQSSRVSAELHERDPENRLFARGPRFRLAAGTIRDQALMAAGLLGEEIGGAPVRPYQPPGLWKEVSDSAYEPGEGAQLYRRSLYTYWKRTVAPPSMMNFDASDREVCAVHVKRTNTPLQALNLMNDTTFVEAARHLAESVVGQNSGIVSERISEIFQRVLGRSPRHEEIEILVELFRSYMDAFEADRDSAEALLGVGDSAWNEQSDPRELASYAGVASLVLNLDEAVTKQ